MSKLVEAAARHLSLDTSFGKVISEGTEVHSDYEDGYGPVKVKVGSKTIKSDHYYNEEPHGDSYKSSDRKEYHSYLTNTHKLSDHEAKAVIHHMDTIRKGKAKESEHEGYTAKSTYN